MTGPIISYTIDDQDKLIEVDNAFYKFAADGNWREVDAVLGRSLWSFVAGAEMQRVQRILLRRLRDERRRIELPFRCDSPDVRREMKIRITPRSSGEIQFIAWPTSETEREPQPLLDPSSPRREELLTMCGWCDRFRVEGEWVEVEVAAEQLELPRRGELPAISHGICDPCGTMLMTS